MKKKRLSWYEKLEKKIDNIPEGELLSNKYKMYSYGFSLSGMLVFVIVVLGFILLEVLL